MNRQIQYTCIRYPCIKYPWKRRYLILVVPLHRHGCNGQVIKFLCKFILEVIYHILMCIIIVNIYSSFKLCLFSIHRSYKMNTWLECYFESISLSFSFFFNLKVTEHWKEQLRKRQHKPGIMVVKYKYHTWIYVCLRDL